VNWREERVCAVLLREDKCVWRTVVIFGGDVGDTRRSDFLTIGSNPNPPDLLFETQ